MRETNKLFHLAVPCADLDETEKFYGTLPGCRKARRYDDRVTFDFFGDQLVCHLCPEGVDREPRMYPRHFGVTFLERKEFDDLLRLARQRDIPFFQEPFVRFEGLAEEHETFFLRDPANNLLEFKFYHDPRMAY